MTVNSERTVQQALAETFDQVDRMTRGQPRFNCWFYVGNHGDIASIYLRCVRRKFDAPLADQLGIERDTYVLDLANVEVREAYRSQGVATAIINKCIALAVTRRLQLKIENVLHPYLIEHLNKRPDFVAVQSEEWCFPSYYYYKRQV